MAYLGSRSEKPSVKPQPVQPQEPSKVSPIQFNGTDQVKPATVISGEDEIIEMTRMGKLIAHHMVESVQTSAHVQSFIEADVTVITSYSIHYTKLYESSLFLRCLARNFPSPNR